MPEPTSPEPPTFTLFTRIGRFLLSGGTAALVNLLMLHGLVTLAGMRGGWREDLANLLALELSALVQFTLCRHWVWRNASQASLWRELLTFHGAIALTATGRTLLFSVLRLAGLHYLPNAVLGIGLAAVANFLLYEKVVFRKRVG